MAAMLRAPLAGLAGRVTSPSGFIKTCSKLRVKPSFLGLSTTVRNYGTPGLTVSSCAHQDDGVVLGWGGDGVQSTAAPWSKYHYFWLRDNCMCSQCYHPHTNQRLVDAFSVPLDLKPKRVEFSQDSKALVVEWEDGHKSEYPSAWLKKNSYEGEGMGDAIGKSDTAFEVCRWGTEIASSPPEADFTNVMESDEGLYECLKKIKKYGFCFIKGTPTDSSEHTKKLMETRIGVIRMTFYGQFWDFTNTVKLARSVSDTAYTNLAIASHTDGNYFTEAPGLEVFHCLHFEGTGGQSYLVDGLKIAEEIRKRSPEDFKILSTVPFTYHYSDSKHRLVNSNIPFVLDDHSGEIKRVHFNDADRTPMNFDQVEALKRIGDYDSDVPPMQRLYEAWQMFGRTMRDKALVYRFQLEPGKFLVFNNHRVLHARTAFTGTRRMAGCYVNMEYFDSKLRLLSKKYE